MIGWCEAPAANACRAERGIGGAEGSANPLYVPRGPRFPGGPLVQGKKVVASSSSDHPDLWCGAPQQKEALAPTYQEIKRGSVFVLGQGHPSHAHRAISLDLTRSHSISGKGTPLRQRHASQAKAPLPGKAGKALGHTGALWYRPMQTNAGRGRSTDGRGERGGKEGRQRNTGCGAQRHSRRRRLRRLRRNLINQF